MWKTGKLILKSLSWDVKWERNLVTMEEFINGPCLETKRVKLHSRKTSEEAYHKDLEIESYL